MTQTLIGSTALTLADVVRRSDDDGKIASIVNLLSQTNDLLDDMLWVEGNLPTGHKTTIRTGLPQAAWRLLNYGVPKTKSTTAQVVDTCGMLEVYSEIDKALADLNGNTAEVRMSEDLAFIEGLNQQMAQAVFYGNTAQTPQAFNGLAPRFSGVSSANGGNTYNNVFDAGGTGSTNTSIWIVVWGPNTVAGIYPKGSKSGLQMRDLGEWTLTDAAGGQYQGYRTLFKWDCGLTVRDWRYVVRIANIDVTTLAGGSPPNLVNFLIRALHKLPTAPVAVSNTQTVGAPGAPQNGPTMGRTAIYMNRTVATWLDVQSRNLSNALLTLDDRLGKPVLKFRGVPIRICDQILSTEARLT